MDDNDRKVFADIEKFGCHVLHVFDPDGVLPDFTYSVGITKASAAPEVVVIGLKREMGISVVNEYNRRVREGELFRPEQQYADFLEGFGVLFESVDKKHFDEYFGHNLWLYGGPDFEVVQLIYPTTSGVWPWDDEASEWFRAHQPLLGKTPFAGRES